jgi:anti-sigma B factor antagonist
VKDLIHAGSKELVLNFAQVLYIHSTGLGFLAGARITAQNAGVHTILASLNMDVRKVLDDVKLTQFFTISEDEAAALARLKEAGLPVEASQAAPAKPLKGKRVPRRLPKP